MSEDTEMDLGEQLVLLAWHQQRTCDPGTCPHCRRDEEEKEEDAAP